MVVVGALVGAGVVWFLRSGSAAKVAGTAAGSATAPVTLESAGAPGDDPFVQATQLVGVPDLLDPASVAPIPAAADPASGTQLIGGDTPLLYAGNPPGDAALYGGSNQQAVCDPAALIDFLGANPDKAKAWADVFGLTTGDIPAFVRSLTPVVLLRDTAVTNHGFTGGRAVPRQAVLQAGSAVLVDRFGVPAVRCACGNPLLPPKVADLPAADFVGDRWTGFDPGRVFSVGAAASPLTTFTVVDVVSGQPLDLRAGAVAETLAAVGKAGVALSDDGVTWHPVPGSPAGTQIVSGGGTLLVLSTSTDRAGPSATITSSTDGGLTWSEVAGAPADATFAAFDGARWLLLAEPDPYGIFADDAPTLSVVLYTSDDLSTWTAQDVTIALEPLPPSDDAMLTYVDIVSFGAGDGRVAIGALLADTWAASRQYLFSSTDLTTWQQASWESGSVVLPNVAWDGRTWGMTASRYDGLLRDGDSSGVAGPAATDLSGATPQPTNDGVGLGSLDNSATAGWLATGWRGADWQDPGLYTSADLTTWTRVSDLPGHGFDVTAVTAGAAGPPDLSALPTITAPALVTGSGCPPMDDVQPIVTTGQVTCAAISRLEFGRWSGPQTGGNKVASLWHHWGCSWGVLPDIDAGRTPAYTCAQDQAISIDFWPVRTAPAGTATGPPDAGAGGPGAGGADEPEAGGGSDEPGDAGPSDGGISVTRPMANPACDGTPIVIYASAVTPGRYSTDIQSALDTHPGASWVRTDRSCSSFARSTADGGPIYAIYQAFPTVSAACAEVAAAGGSVGRRFLDNGSPSTSVYSCP